MPKKNILQIITPSNARALARQVLNEFHTQSAFDLQTLVLPYCAESPVARDLFLDAIGTRSVSIPVDHSAALRRPRPALEHARENNTPDGVPLLICELAPALPLPDQAFVPKVFYGLDPMDGELPDPRAAAQKNEIISGGLTLRAIADPLKFPLGLISEEALQVLLGCRGATVITLDLQQAEHLLIFLAQLHQIDRRDLDFVSLGNDQYILMDVACCKYNSTQIMPLQNWVRIRNIVIEEIKERANGVGRPISGPLFDLEREMQEVWHKAAELARSNKPAPHPQFWAGTIHHVSIITCNRPEQLERCLDSYAKSLRFFGYADSVPIYIFDDSRIANEQKNREIAARYAADGLTIRFFGPSREKLYYVSQIKQHPPQEFADDLPEYSRLVAATYGDVGADGEWLGAAGRNRNFALLFAQSHRSLMVDDDTMACSLGVSLETVRMRASQWLGEQNNGKRKTQSAPVTSLLADESAGVDLRNSIPRDVITEASLNQRSAIAANLYGHRDASAVSVILQAAEFDSGNIDALSGDLPLQQPYAIQGRLGFGTSAFITPLAAASLVFPSIGRNQDIIAGKLFNALAHPLSAYTTKHLNHSHLRGPRYVQQLDVLRLEFVATIVTKEIERLGKEKIRHYLDGFLTFKSSETRRAILAELAFNELTSNSRSSPLYVRDCLNKFIAQAEEIHGYLEPRSCGEMPKDLLDEFRKFMMHSRCVAPLLRDGSTSGGQLYVDAPLLRKLRDEFFEKIVETKQLLEDVKQKFCNFDELQLAEEIADEAIENLREIFAVAKLNRAVKEHLPTIFE